jgi:hypothetical protein
MVIDASGNVGIGKTGTEGLRLETLAPTGFSVGGGFYSGTTQSTITFSDANTTAAYKVRIGSEGDDLLMFAGGSEAMRITSVGTIRTPIGKALTIGQAASTAHSAGNVGSVGLTIMDGGGHSGVFVNNTHDGTYSSQDITFKTADGGVSAATERMRIDVSGNVGIGQDDPSAPLTVDGPSNDAYVARFGNFAGGGGSVQGRTDIGLDFWATDDGTHPAAAVGVEQVGTDQYRGGLVFSTRGTNSDVAPAERMRITSSGLVGIGTDNPSEFLHIDGAAPAVALGNTSGTTDWRMQNVDNSVRWVSNPRAGGAAAERMRIDSSGNLLVGTDVGTGPRLRVERGGIVAEFNRSSGTSSLISFQYGGVDAGYITSSAGGTPSFTAASDERLKDNIVEHESELANVMSLRPTRWDWKEDAKGSGEGFIAQELEATAWADLVSEGDDGFKQVSGLGAVETRLIKAMQEQQAMIEALKAKVEALENA